MDAKPPEKKSLSKFLLRNISIVKEILPYTHQLKKLMVLSIVLGLLSAAVETATVSIVMLFIFQALSETVAMPDNSIITRVFEVVQNITGDDLILISGVILGLVLLKSAVRGSYNLLTAYVTNTIHHRVRTSLFEKYMSLYYTDLARKDYGAMVNALQVESWYVPEIVKAFSGLLISLCAMTVYLLMITLISWQLTIAIIVLGILMKVLMMVLKEPMRHLGFKTTDMHEKMSAHMHTRMQGLKTIRVHGLEQEEITSFSNLSSRVSKAFTGMALVDTYLKPVYDLSILLIIGALIWTSSAVGNPATVTATVIALLYRLQPYFFGLESALLTLMKSEGPMQALLKQLQGKDMRHDNPGYIAVPKDWQSIRFENIHFRYETDDTLQNIDFTLPRGGVLAITGPSGIGKSTLVNLFLKLTKPSSGKIYLDDHDFEDIKRLEWQSCISAAGQDFQLLDGTLYDNLTMGRNISEDVIEQALKIAEIKEVVDDLPQGLDTRIGERGIRLSGGQRQRIVLARALAFQPDFLVLDEATSEVSIPIEQKIYSNIKTAYPDMTIVLITHRSLPPDFVDQEVRL